MNAGTEKLWESINPIILDGYEDVIGKELSSGYSVLITEEVVKTVQNFLKLDTEREHGGFLLGGVMGDSKSTDFTTVIKEVISCPEANGSMSHLTFDHDCWEQAHSHPAMQDESLSIVGWFHSHPGMSLKMSKKDVFIQEQFFPENWQVAWIVDSINDTYALYSFNGQEIETVKNVRFIK